MIHSQKGLSAGASHFYCLFVMLFSQERLVNVEFITSASLFVRYITVWIAGVVVG